MKRNMIIAATALFAVATTAVIATAKGGPGNGHGRGGIERLFENLDSDGDGAITKSEAEAAGAARFAAADANGDGLLTADEMAAAAQNRQAERIAKRIEKLDANGDGALSLEEMSAKGSKRLAHMFDRLDADGDGVITKAEAEAAKGMRRGKHQRGGDNNE